MTAKFQPVFVFERGALNIKQSGYGNATGSGYFTFEEDDLEWEPHDDSDGNYAVLKMCRSDLIELRNFLVANLDNAED